MRECMTLVDVAEWLQLHPASVRRMLKRREIPGFKVGSDWRFNPRDLELWLEQITGKSPHRPVKAS
jgi:excisionase family DNA binding protein